MAFNNYINSVISSRKLIVIDTSTKNNTENNLKVDIPRLLKNNSLRFSDVSFEKYHKKIVRSSLVTIAAIIFGLTIVIIMLIKKDHKTNDL